MNRSVHFRHGAAYSMGGGRCGFTLLETCMVLLIIAILLGAMMPAIHSAFVENAMRIDERQLSLMIKTAMLQSTDRHRDYVLDLSTTNLDLHPAEDGDAAAPAADAATNQDSDEDEQSYRLDGGRLLIPDPARASSWITMPATSWFFHPGELCPATRVRLMRGNAWLELSFNALTGNVENETANFP